MLLAGRSRARLVDGMLAQRAAAGAREPRAQAGGVEGVLVRVRARVGVRARVRVRVRVRVGVRARVRARARARAWVRVRG